MAHKTVWMMVLISLFAFCLLFAQTPGTLKWEHVLDEGTYSSLAMGNGGTLYCAGLVNGDGSLLAFNPDGTEKWNFLYGENEWSRGFSNLVIGSDGNLYGIFSLGEILSVGPTGALNWSYRLTNTVISALSIGEDNTLYCGCSNGFPEDNITLYALNPDGTLKWKGNQSVLRPSTLTILPNGQIVTNTGNWLIAFTNEGLYRWQFKSEQNDFRTSTIVDNEGTIYCGAEKKLYAINADGSLKWVKDLGWQLYDDSPVIGPDGNIYVTTVDTLFALDSNGNILRSQPIENGEKHAIQFGEDGILYLSSWTNPYTDSLITHSLYALNPDGTTQWEYPVSSKNNPVLALDGTFYLLSTDNRLLAFNTSSKGLAQTFWPRPGRDNQNTNDAFQPSCPITRVNEDTIFLSDPNSVFLDASSSYDPDGAPISYQWQIYRKPAESQTVLSDSTSPAITVDLDGQHRGKTIFSVIVRDGKHGASVEYIHVFSGIKWLKEIDTRFPPKNALNHDGTILVTQDSSLSAFNPDGTVRWKYHNLLRDHYPPTPYVGGDGTIYLANSDTLYAIDQDGFLKWTWSSNGYCELNMIGPDDIVYLSSNGVVTAITSNGEKYWERKLDYSGFDGLYGAPAIGADGTIYQWPYALNPDGRLKWIFKTSPNFLSLLTFDSEGYFYFHDSWDYLIKKINPDGTFNRDIKLDTKIQSVGIVGADHTLFCPTWWPPRLNAFDSEAHIKWVFDMPNTIEWYYLCLDQNGVVYALTQDYADVKGNYYQVYALNSSGSLLWTCEVDNNFLDVPLLADDGTLYCMTSGKLLYAITGEGAGLAEGDWPTHYKDNQRTCNGYNPDCPHAVVAHDTIRVRPGEAIQLDGSASYDPGGDPLHYLWCIIQKPENSTLALNDSLSSVINLSIPSEDLGTFDFSLTVSDQKDGLSTQRITVINGYEIGKVLWSYKTGGKVRYSTGLDDQGNVYATSTDGKLYAIASNGVLKWASFVSDAISSPPVINIADATIYVSSLYGELFTYELNGALKWSFETQDDSLSVPSIGVNGTIYVGGKQFYAVKSSGKSDWNYEVRGAVRFPPAIDADGNIYLVDNANYLTVLRPDGSMKWEKEFRSNQSFLSRPVLDYQGYIYVTTSRGITVFDDEGKLQWEYKTNLTGLENIDNLSLVIDEDGTQYLALTGRVSSLLAIDVYGNLKSGYGNSDGAITPAIGADGLIYSATNGYDPNFTFFAMDTSGEQKWSIELGDSVISPPIINPNGMVIFGCNDSCVYAVGSTSLGLARNCWPRYGQNNQNTSSHSDSLTHVGISSRESNIPKTLVLAQNYPNPFNPETTIRFGLPTSTHVQVILYNVLGREIRKLKNETLHAGWHSVIWNGKDASGLSMDSGIYLLVLRAKDRTMVRKITLIR